MSAIGPSVASARVRVPPARAARMIAAWAWGKIRAQIEAVAFLVLYLAVVQVFVLRAPVRDALGIAFGVGATVVGLAMFLEGLFLGIMPLGERCGLKLPGRISLPLILLFSLVLGVTATLAEPAIGFLKLQGSTIRPWDSPLLYFLLNRGSGLLVVAVAAGVGLAVALGVLRFIYGWSFKPFVFAIVPILLVLEIAAERTPGVAAAAALAWDTGGITTGPVTVPLVIALGLGISRLGGTGKDGSGGLGVVTLASTLPVAAVLALAFAAQPLVPLPGSATDFFSPDARAKAEFAAGGSEALERLADGATKDGALSPALRAAWFGAAAVPDSPPGSAATAGGAGASAASGMIAFVGANAQAALKAVLPLSLVLLATLLLVLRDRPRTMDEIALGLAFALVGMFLFGMGMEKGLSALGSQTGASIPRAYRETPLSDQAELVPNLERSDLFDVHSPTGTAPHFWLDGPDGPRAVPFDEAQYDEATRAYRHVPVRKPVFARFGAWAGYAAVLLFVFVLGLGATLAEPSLLALGMTIEEVTTGTYKSRALVLTVGVGVGIGMVVGFGRLLVDLPLSLALGVPYAIALILTAFSSEEFSAIAWDSAGVTTGPVTVPLVIATGLGMGTGSSGGAFGVLAAASAFPIVTVLVSGLFVRAAARRYRAPAAAPDFVAAPEAVR